MSDKKEASAALDATVAQMNKQFGAGAVMRLGNSNIAPVRDGVIPTGSIALDAALGVGGLPRGRVIEIFGPESSGKTTLALHVIASAQKAGGTAAFIDAEHALDPVYAKALGVNTDDLLVSQPDNGEQALDIADSLIKGGTLAVCVVDSVAALVPKAELDGDMGDSHMGLHARLMSQALRKITGNVSKTKTCMIFINQIREKIGVMFGCFSYTTRVVLADGSTEKIGKLVNQKMGVQVRSFDVNTGEVVNRRVVNWFKNGKTGQFLQFTVEKSGGNGVSRFGVTDSHIIFTPHGERHAGDLVVGDEVLAQARLCFNSIQLSIAAGSVLGDGSVRKTGGHTYQMRFGHGRAQVKYAKWKASLFGDLVAWTGNTGTDGWGFDLKPSYDAKEYFIEGYQCGGSRILSAACLRDLTPLSVAIWYMDDGSFSGSYAKWGCGTSEIGCKSYNHEEVERLADRLVELGFPRPTTGEGRLRWSGKDNRRFQSRVASYVHPSMDYKIHPNLRGQFINIEQVKPDYRLKMVPVRIVDIYVKPPTRSMERFDIEVEGGHSYLVDGVGVHNSPETTTGGRALKFYASVRLDVRRVASIKNGDEVIGVRTKVKVVKNKVAPPFREAQFDIVYGVGISREGDLLDVGVATGAVEQKGAWYSYKGERLGQGRDAAIKFLLGAPPLFNTIWTEVLAGILKVDDPKKGGTK